MSFSIQNSADETAAGNVEKNAESLEMVPLRSLLADDQCLGTLVEKFITRLPVRASEVQSALDHCEWGVISVLAHQMSGAAGGYGFPEISQAAANLEQTVKSDPSSQSVRPAVVALKALYARACIGRNGLH